jgi:preprotein translocase subunit SecE
MLQFIGPMQDFSFTAPDFSGGPVQFLRQVRDELKKVVWPDKKQLVKLTTTVIIVSLAVGLYIGLLDLGFTKVMEIFIRK